MSSLVYDNTKLKAGNGTINLGSDTFKMMLVTSTYTPTQAHAFRSDVTNEVTGTGYTAGGSALTSVTWTLDSTNHRAVFSSAAPAWSASTITARAAVIYKSRGGAATADELVCYNDFGSDQTSTNGTFTVNVPAAGWMNAS